MADDVELITRDRTSETIKIASLKINDKKRYKSCLMAKMCFLFSQLGRENLLPLEQNGL